MYSDKINSLILTSLLRQHGVRHVVACPGSRNAPIVHDLCTCGSETGDMKVVAVTDERCAGFYAIGISQAHDYAPVVVCVTSGSAMLNVAPAVAEAYYQHVPLIVISADRPQEWIGQRDGQTMPQSGALGSFVVKTVNLPEVLNDNDHWYCNRLVNEALIEAESKQRPVHVNVPLSKPLMHLVTPQLSVERVIEAHRQSRANGSMAALIEALASDRLLVVFGQTRNLCADFQNSYGPWLRQMENMTSGVVLNECLSNTTQRLPLSIDKALDLMGTAGEEYAPSHIIYMGGMLISNKLKDFLRRCKDAKTVVITDSDDVYDTFQNTVAILSTDTLEMALAAADVREDKDYGYRQRWNTLLQNARNHGSEEVSAQYAAVDSFIQELEYHLRPEEYSLQAANSSSVRLVGDLSSHFVYCNRGVNGIEGCLSTAAGMSLSRKTFCVTGDLSFFYDSNALWNSQLNGNLRILLINDGHGAIFDRLPGVCDSSFADRYVAGRHGATAEGICQSYDATYLKATDEEALQTLLPRFVGDAFDRPVVLEILI